MWPSSGQYTTGTPPTEESGPLAENAPLTAMLGLTVDTCTCVSLGGWLTGFPYLSAWFDSGYTLMRPFSARHDGVLAARYDVGSGTDFLKVQKIRGLACSGCFDTESGTNGRCFLCGAAVECEMMLDHVVFAVGHGTFPGARSTCSRAWPWRPCRWFWLWCLPQL